MVVTNRIFIVLGADNVGKTTMLNRSMAFAKVNLGRKCFYKHFSAPKPGQTPTEMYVDALYSDIEQAVLDGHHYLYVDRAWPESKFYEFERRNLVVDYETIFKVEQRYLEFARHHGYDITFNLMVKPWEFVEKFHIDELEHAKDFVKQSALMNQEPVDLAARRLEHGRYYRFMKDYQITREMQIPEVVINFPWNNLDVRDIDFVLV
jgi:hypothetical protein